MSQVEELLRRQIEHDESAAREAQKSDHLSAIAAAKKTQLDVEKSIRDHREDRLETLFKFATSSIQGLTVSPIASHGLKYLTPVLGAIGLIYMGIKKGRLMSSFEEAGANATKSSKGAEAKLALMGLDKEGNPLKKEDTSTPADPGGTPHRPGILALS